MEACLQTERKTKPLVTAAQVHEYLQHHPAFLAENSDLLLTLTPPGQSLGAGVEDFQRHMISRLQRELGDLQSFGESLIATSRNNHAGQTQIHVAALLAMDAESLDHLVHVITHDWVDVLNMDAVALCLADPFPGDTSFAASGISLIEPVDMDRLLGREAVALRNRIMGHPDLYGPAAPLVQAEALVRVEPGKGRPGGFLALGSRDPDGFAPAQGTELLRFLGAMTERLLDQWWKPRR